METITVNGKTYYSEMPKKQFEGATKIVVLQRGWVLVGIFEEKENGKCFLHNSSVIRNWGTTKGLGELAENGPLSSTKLDKCNGVVEFDSLTKVLSISVNEEKWASKL